MTSRSPRRDTKKCRQGLGAREKRLFPILAQGLHAGTWGGRFLPAEALEAVRYHQRRRATRRVSGLRRRITPCAPPGSHRPGLAMGGRWGASARGPRARGGGQRNPAPFGYQACQPGRGGDAAGAEKMRKNGERACWRPLIPPSPTASLPATAHLAAPGCGTRRAPRSRSRIPQRLRTRWGSALLHPGFALPSRCPTCSFPATWVGARRWVWPARRRLRRGGGASESEGRARVCV